MRAKALAQQGVEPVDDARDPNHSRPVPFEPAQEQTPQGPLVGEERHEVEPAPQGGVDEGYRSVGGVHGADDQQAFGQREAGIAFRVH